MQLISRRSVQGLSTALVSLSMLVILGGCEASANKHPEPATRVSAELASPQAENSLSKQLYPLSSSYGACIDRHQVLRGTLGNGMTGFPTSAHVAAYGAELDVAVGKFALDPGSIIAGQIPSSSAKRIQLIQSPSRQSLLVSNFDSSRDKVLIDFDPRNPRSRSAAERLAKDLVPCALIAR